MTIQQINECRGWRPRQPIPSMFRIIAFVRFVHPYKLVTIQPLKFSEIGRRGRCPLPSKFVKIVRLNQRATRGRPYEKILKYSYFTFQMLKSLLISLSVG